MSSSFVQRPERRPFGSRAAMAGPGPGPGDPDEQYDFLFKLVLVGDASVGKTCVVQRFKTGAFSERQGSTIGVDFTMKTLEIQGKRVKVGGPAWGRRAGVAWRSLPAAQPGLRRVPGLTGAPRRRFFSGGGRRPQRAPRIVLRFLANPFRLPLSLLLEQAWALGSGSGSVLRAPALGCVCVLGVVWGSRPCPPELTPRGHFCSKISSPVEDRRAPRSAGDRRPPGWPDSSPPRSKPPARPLVGGTRPESYTRPPLPSTTRRDQEVVVSRTGGPKLFVRISGLATPPCSLFVDLVVELYSTRASTGSPPPAGV